MDFGTVTWIEIIFDLEEKGKDETWYGMFGELRSEEQDVRSSISGFSIKQDVRTSISGLRFFGGRICFDSDRMCWFQDAIEIYRLSVKQDVDSRNGDLGGVHNVVLMDSEVKWILIFFDSEVWGKDVIRCTIIGVSKLEEQDKRSSIFVSGIFGAWIYIDSKRKYCLTDAIGEYRVSVNRDDGSRNRELEDDHKDLLMDAEAQWL